MNEIIEKNIENKIYEIRGVQVMLSSDVAQLYNVETKRINETIKRNINRFPSTFCFQLTNKEIDELSSRSQFVTLNKSSNFSRSQFATLNRSNNLRGYNIKYLPYVLTEQGIMMLSGLLKSDIAVKVNIEIVDAFVKMRHCIIENKDYLPNRVLLLEEKVDNNTKKINEIFDRFDRKDIKKNQILFEGEIYDAYSLLMDIFSISEEEIIIIDNYAGKELLDILKNINKKITIVSSNIDSVLKKKYESQYSNITFINNNSFHDRFIIIDKRILYTCGSSFKDLGKKCFSINRFDDNEYLNKISEAIKM